MKNAAFGKTDAIKRLEKKFGQRKSQKGFTLVELVVVLFILALIIAVLSSGLFQSKEDAKVQAVKTQLLNTFPSAITRIVTMYNKCNNTVITKDKLIERGAPTETVFQSAWTVTTSGGNTTTLTYPLDLQDGELATGLVDALQVAPNVKSVSGTSSKIEIAYRCN
ncbi:prepilin-type N-terminal cleavage/methylation domain-containing protein [Pseudomonas syringae]|uniref:prepilin-type N-terminal cleavage/methylation domain-containing protein n=1 Tax=Pseudomonas syringae TaxID=317 RepID=UPI001F422DEA|nr:prepilin-type N-terminal cleavage/methylation domain-containing protein [Pseudomonas syringae]MCF5371289.1 prepilin-type N-terminal cleavage/methylation domain-containing protein [Pseudomonas syringae]MCF5382114.1 prepilin-type N-terminal cleavage/methylation domain-containing protein [Pseudomonas syringae]MCF5422943.1 prepilin-type N-terminal cleavage/methylation domain-containing protein [Pseudomonas syringae]MCF5455016.1 prepilin-type N-terminal cleavage/methylation domain-containing prot